MAGLGGGRMQSRLGVLIGVVAVILAVAGMIGPWWVNDVSESAGAFSGSGHADFGLFGGTSSYTFGSNTGTNTTNYQNAPHVGSVFTLAIVVTILGLLVGVAMILVGFMAAAKPSMGRMAAALGVLAFIVLLIGTLYVMSSLPTAVNQDTGSGNSFTTVSGFWGTKSSSFFGFTANFAWAAGWGWYVVLVSAILFLMAGIVLLVGKKATSAPVMPVPPSA